MYCEQKNKNLKNKKSMARTKTIMNAVDQAFHGMKQRKEKSVIVGLFPFNEPQSLAFPSGGIYQAHFAQVLLVRNTKKKTKQNFVKILYRSANKRNPKGRFETLSWNELKEKIGIVEFLKSHAILPSPKEFLEAKSLANTPSAANILGGCEVMN